MLNGENRMKIKMPELNDEKIEILDYGLHLIIGEIPKVFIMILLAFLLGVGDLALLAFLLMLPYRSYSGGFHLQRFRIDASKSRPERYALQDEMKGIQSLC